MRNLFDDDDETLNANKRDDGKSGRALPSEILVGAAKYDPPHRHWIPPPESPLNAHTQALSHTLVHTHTLKCTLTLTLFRTYTDTHARTHIHTHVRTHERTNTRTH